MQSVLVASFRKEADKLNHAQRVNKMIVGLRGQTYGER